MSERSLTLRSGHFTLRFTVDDEGFMGVTITGGVLDVQRDPRAIGGQAKGGSFVDASIHLEPKEAARIAPWLHGSGE